MFSKLSLNLKLTSYIRLFIYSIIFETLLFFIFFPGAQLSRMLQLIFILITGIIFLFVILRNIKLEVDITFIENNPPLYFFIFLIPISFLVGFFSGNLSFDLNIYQLNDFSSVNFNRAVFLRFINEVFILFYYFIFFYFFTYLLINKKDSIDFFFRVFKIFFILHLFIGYADFLLILNGIDLVPRHLYDGINVGSRFHGIAGEPRQAGVYMAFGLAITYLESFYNGTKYNLFWPLTTIPAIFLTLSFTTIISIIIFIALLMPVILLIFYRNPLYFLITMIFLTYLFYLVTQVPRISEYIEIFSFKDGFYILENSSELPYLIRVQLGEIYPLYDQYKALLENNYWQFLFGSGIGTSAIVNYSYVDIPDAFGNPNSQLIRSIYESGFIGTLIFISIFYWPIIKNNKIDKNKRLLLYVFTSIALAFSLGVRSPAIFIYLGIMSSILSSRLYLRHG